MNENLKICIESILNFKLDGIQWIQWPRFEEHQGFMFTDLFSIINNTFPEDLSNKRKWDEINIKRICKTMSNEFEDENKSRFLALQEKESNHWVQAYPSPNLRTFMDNSTFEIAIALRFDIIICQTHTCKCGKITDRYGHRALRCEKGAGRLPRHRELNNIIYGTLISLNIPSILESPGVSRLEGKRADGLKIAPWIKGKSFLWDATCVDTLCPSYLL